MTQHPEEGTLHAYIDGELSPAEAATLELHVGGCARCAAALAEARGLTAAASRVITTLDAAPSSAAAPAAPIVVGPAVPARRTVRPLIFRLPYARAAALLLLVGGTAVVVDRTGTFPRGKSSQAESLTADVASPGEVAPAAGGQVATPPAVTASGVVAEADFSGAPGAVRGRVAQDAAAPPRAVAGRAGDGSRRARSVETSALAAEAAPSALVEQRGVAGGTPTKPQAAAPAVALAGKDATPTVMEAAPHPVAPPAPPPPARASLRLEEVVVTGAASFAPTVSRYRTEDGVILTLTEEPLRTSFAEESAATLRSAPPPPQRRTAAPMAASPISSYRWSSTERGKIYTLSGPLTVAQLEALSKRLSELERLP